jgi:hypothetical protein
LVKVPHKTSRHQSAVDEQKKKSISPPKHAPHQILLLMKLFTSSYFLQKFFNFGMLYTPEIRINSKLFASVKTRDESAVPRFLLLRIIAHS